MKFQEPIAAPVKKRRRAAENDVEPWGELWARLVQQGWKRIKGTRLEQWRFVKPEAAMRLSGGKKVHIQLGCDYFVCPQEVVAYCKKHSLLPPPRDDNVLGRKKQKKTATTPVRIKDEPPAKRQKVEASPAPIEDRKSKPAVVASKKAPVTPAKAKTTTKAKATTESKPTKAKASPTKLKPKLVITRPIHNRNTRLAAGPIPFTKRNSPSFALFGFNCTSTSDVVRMRALQDLYRVRLTSASEQEAPLTPIPIITTTHYSCDFKQSLLSGLDTETAVLMLDYFWLQGNWWFERYGANWISKSTDCKLVRAFHLCPKLKVCILPLDAHKFMQNRAVEHRAEFREAAGLDLELISWHEAQHFHPLCLATALAKEKYLQRAAEKKSFDGHVRYVTAPGAKNSKSFVVVFRQGIKWRQLIQGFLS